MTTHITAATGETTKLYHLNPVHQQAVMYLALVLLPLVALIPIVALSREFKITGTISVGTIVLVGSLVGVGLFAFGYLRRVTNRTSLLLSSSGLEYYGSGISIKTGWDNTKEITRSALPHLLLHQAAGVYRGWLPNRDPFAQQRIPLYLFEYTPQSALA